MHRTVLTLLLTLMVAPALACAAEEYEVHDSTRPQPPAVAPGTASKHEQPGKPPADAVVLFDGKDLSKWQGSKDKSAALWKVENGELVVAPKTGNIQTKQEFGDVQVHAEWLEPK